MNPHLELVIKSVLAPRKAVDMALQHPNAFQLALLYLVAACVAGFLIPLLMPLLVSPLQAYDPAVSGEATILDRPLFEGIFTALISVIMFCFSRWFWRKAAESAVPSAAIDSAIAVSFASGLALLIPQETLFRLYENASTAASATITLVSMGVSIVLSTIYFCSALSISMVKSFWLNLVFTVLFLLSAGLIVFVMMMVTGDFSSEAGVAG